MLTENARAREEAERRIAAANRRMDHLERARREEEAPLLERAYQTKVPHPPPSGLHARASVLSLIPRLLGCSCLPGEAAVAPLHMQYRVIIPLAIITRKRRPDGYCPSAEGADIQAEVLACALRRTQACSRS